MTHLAILLLSIIPRDDVARETVDLVEVNHFYDEQVRLVFTQIIFYDWQGYDSRPDGVLVHGERYQVRAWRLAKNPAQLPQRDWENGGYSAFWQDGEQTRFVRALSFRETWLQADVELIEREVLAKERRKELRTLPLRRAKR